MRKLRFTTVLLVCVLSVCGVSLAQGPAEANCIIRITSDPAVFPVNFETVKRLIESNNVGGKAITDVLGGLEESTGHSANRAIFEQLNQTVDLSVLGEETILAEAIDIIANSVEPPLPITVLWNCLNENAFISPEQPIRCTIQSPVLLRIGLKLVLESVSAGQSVNSIDYVVEGGVIKIASSENLTRDSRKVFRVQPLPSQPTALEMKSGPAMGGMGMGGGFGGAAMDGMGGGYGGAMMGSGRGGGMEDGMGGMEMMSPPYRSRDRAVDSEQTLLMSFQVVVEEKEQSVAEELMAAVVENLREALEKAHDDYSSRFNGQLESAVQQAMEAEEKFVSLQKKLRSLSGGKDLRHERISEQVQHLSEKLSEEEMQIELDNIIVQDLAARIAEAKKEADKRLEEDSLTREIKEMIEQQIRQLGNIEKLVESGNADAVQLEEMREKIVRAKIVYAERRENLHAMPGSDLVSRLREEMADRSTEISLANARLGYFHRNLSNKQQLLGMADVYELTNIQIDVARQNLRESMGYANEIRRRTRMIQPPMVSVIGAE